MQHQVELEEAAADELARAALAGAEVIAKEVRQQTDDLTSTMEELAARASADLFGSTNEITSAVEWLGDRLCASLDEIKWQVAQASQTLDQVLKILLNSRNNEAQQLVRQGVRHFVNGEYTEAEERFRRALEYDSTDYHVLLNLAFIEIHKDSAPAAVAYFQKAVSLPDNLDSASKERALWAWARLHYAEGQYKRALEIAQEAMALRTPPTARDFLTTGVYAARASDGALCLKTVRQAIEADPTFFARAAVEPSFGGSRAEVLNLLSTMASNALAGASQAVGDARTSLNRITSGRYATQYEDLVASVGDRIDQAGKVLRAASYSDSLALTRSMVQLRGVIDDIPQLDPLYANLGSAQRSLTESEDRHAEVWRQHGTFATEEIRAPRLAPMWLLKLAMYVIPSFTAGWTVPSLTGIGLRIALAVLWPFFFLLSFVPGAVERDAYAWITVYRRGVLVGVVLSGVVWFVFRLGPKIAFENSSRENARKRERIAESEAALEPARERFEAANRQIQDTREHISQGLARIIVTPRTT